MTKCSDCGREFGFFRWRKQCVKCERTRCGDCLHALPAWEWMIKQPWPVGERWCKGCIETMEPERQRYEAAVEAANHVETWPRTYKGKIPRDPQASAIEISSNYCGEKNASEFQLKVAAALAGFDIIYELRFDKDTRSEPGSGQGTHYFTVWAATGTATKRLGSRRAPG
jgi:hypothetical protein